MQEGMIKQLNQVLIGTDILLDDKTLKPWQKHKLRLVKMALQKAVKKLKESIK